MKCGCKAEIGCKGCCKCLKAGMPNALRFANAAGMRVRGLNSWTLQDQNLQRCVLPPPPLTRFCISFCEEILVGVRWHSLEQHALLNMANLAQRFLNYSRFFENCNKPSLRLQNFLLPPFGVQGQHCSAT